MNRLIDPLRLRAVLLQFLPLRQHTLMAEDLPLFRGLIEMLRDAPLYYLPCTSAEIFTVNEEPDLPALNRLRSWMYDNIDINGAALVCDSASLVALVDTAPGQRGCLSNRLFFEVQPPIECANPANYPLAEEMMAERMADAVRLFGGGVHSVTTGIIGNAAVHNNERVLRAEVFSCAMFNPKRALVVGPELRPASMQMAATFAMGASEALLEYSYLQREEQLAGTKVTVSSSQDGLAS